MTTRPARTARDALRDSVASMSDRQLALIATEIGVRKATLVAYGEGRSSLPHDCQQRLVERLYRGAFMTKRREETIP